MVSERPLATVVWDDRFRSYEFGEGHPFTETSRWLSTRLLRAGLTEPATPMALDCRENVDPAGAGLLEKFHTPEYIDRVRRLSGADAPALLDRGDTPSFPGCYEAASRIVGGTVAAFRSIRDSPVHRALQPAGGLHHAHPDQASGFCIFNDLAVATRDALDTESLRRIAYVDIDVHHGDGMLYGFYDDGRVLDIDFHQDGRTIFPGTGEVTETGRGDGSGLKVNLPLPPGSGDAVVGPLFRRVVPDRIRAFRPEAILLQCGADGHVGDRLGGLQYTLSTYALAVATLRDLADEVCGGRLLVTGGGGYAASNVARVLALAGAVLGGATPSAPETALPTAWRTEFESATDETAPHRWGEHPTVRPGPDPVGVVESLVGELERALGVRIPV